MDKFFTEADFNRPTPLTLGCESNDYAKIFVYDINRDIIRKMSYSEKIIYLSKESKVKMKGNTHNKIGK